MIARLAETLQRDFTLAERLRLEDFFGAECRLRVEAAAGPTANAAALLATLGADQRRLPAEMRGLTSVIANGAHDQLRAGGPIGVAEKLRLLRR